MIGAPPAASIAAELTIESIAAGGDGVGRLDGMVAFVPRSAPGDRIVASLSPRKGFARGVVAQVVEASPLRVEPECLHYTADRCGGCQLQHLGYGAQIDAKAGIIRDGVTRIGRRTIELPAVVASPRQWRYRSKLTLALRRRGGRWIAGLHPYDDPVAVFALDDCPITDVRVVAAWRQVLAMADLLPDVPALRGSVRLAGEASDAVTLVVEGADTWKTSDRFFASLPPLSSLWWKPDNRPRQLIAAREQGERSRAGASFAQVNAEVAAALRAHVIERVMSYGPATAVDAYAGVGDTAAALAAAGVRVTAIELDRDAAAVCRGRLELPSCSVAGMVEDLLPRALPADVVIVNPPRTGLDARVSALLAQANPAPRAVIYVSCNPATLGRDLARMPGFRIASVLGFDMFPQTAHVETVCELVPTGAAA